METVKKLIGRRLKIIRLLLDFPVSPEKILKSNRGKEVVGVDRDPHPALILRVELIPGAANALAGFNGDLNGCGESHLK
jgi:hypothetical protein